MKRLAEQLTYSNVMVTVLAVIVLGGGTAYAASAMLPKGSVGMGQLKKGAVTPAKLSKAAKATLVGPTGPQGPRGETGPKGEAGEAATKLFAQIRSDGTVNTSSVPVTVDHYSTGTYFIDFGRDISHCVLLANEGSIPVFTTPARARPPRRDTECGRDCRAWAKNSLRAIPRARPPTSKPSPAPRTKTPLSSSPCSADRGRSSTLE